MEQCTGRTGSARGGMVAGAEHVADADGGRCGNAEW